MKLLKPIDNFLNSITMYLLMAGGLCVLLAISIALSLLGKLPIAWDAIALSSIVILTTGYIAEYLFPIIWGVSSNKFSSLITSLILCCIMPPSTSAHNLALLALVCLVAIGSKYIIAIHGKHIFNPAAIAALIFGLTSLLPATWWIGSPAMLIPCIIFGVLVLRKIRRFQLFFSFMLAAVVIALFVGSNHSQSLGYILKTTFESSPLIFLGSVMLSEPTTTPPRLWHQYIYGLIVGVIFTSQLRVGSISATPELALIIGNVFAYIVSPKYKLRLHFKNKQELAPQIYDFCFKGASRLKFQPGQYLEWTLPQSSSDLRGNRRIFSIASAVGEDEIHIAIRIPEKSSTFKRDLMSLKPGDIMQAGQLSGDFVLPRDTKKKVVLIAGGIGITPFVSMAKSLVKTKNKRDIILIYLVSRGQDYCYQDVWQAAKDYGLKIVPVLTGDDIDHQWTGLTGRLTDTVLKDNVPDYLDRNFYISGPSGLVDSYSSLLRSMSLKTTQITTDYFPGY